MPLSPNIETLYASFRDVTGYPDRGAVGKQRFVRCLGLALTQIYQDGPRSQLTEEWRFRSEPPIEAGTVSVHEDDNKVIVLTSGAIGDWPTDRTRDGRWIEIEISSGRWIQRRIQEIFRANYLQLGEHAMLTLDKPWPNTTDADMNYRIYTLDYPYPYGVRGIEWLIRRPESPEQGEFPYMPREVVRAHKLGRNWRTIDKPSFATRGDAFVLQPPRLQPEVSVQDAQANTEKWGFDPSSGIERGNGVSGEIFGPAGTFSYRVCVGWGRRDPATCPTWEAGEAMPFWLSSPSQASGQISTTWGAGRIQIDLPDMDYSHGYQINNSLPSWSRSGLEFWIFRKRHATQDPAAAGNNCDVPRVELSSHYELWKVVDAGTTQVFDQGDQDPVDRRFPLSAWGPQFTLRFDALESEAVDWLVGLIREPVAPENDSDIVNLPPGGMVPVLWLTAAYMASRRLGDLATESSYYSQYVRSLGNLKGDVNNPKFARPRWGDALTGFRGYRRRGILGSTIVDGS